jgi:thiamine-phosphate pyrophosphorylase
VIRYAITGSARFAYAVDFAQVRAKELSGAALTRLTLDILHAAAPGVRVLVNDRADIAIACRCAGVHLRGDSISPAEIRRIAPEGFVISVSCHSIEDVLRADAEGADLVLLSPIFASPGKGEPPMPLVFRS